MGKLNKHRLKFKTVPSANKQYGPAIWCVCSKCGEQFIHQMHLTDNISEGLAKRILREEMKKMDCFEGRTKQLLEV